jgi:FKBP12-rapamycin complex-associated protein
VLARVQAKLTGRDYAKPGAGLEEPLAVPAQVARLVLDATAHDKLCQHYTGWCPFW